MPNIVAGSALSGPKLDGPHPVKAACPWPGKSIQVARFRYPLVAI